MKNLVRAAVVPAVSSVLLLLACAVPTGQAPPPAATQAAAPAPLTADTPSTTNLGNSFVAPAGWTLIQQGEVAVLEAPERGSRVAIVDVRADDDAAAVAAAWARLQPDMKRALRVRTSVAPRNGWSRRASFDYLTSPNEHRDISAIAQHANGLWNVVIEDVAIDVRQKRQSQFGTIYARLLPKGYQLESFVGRKAATLGAGPDASGVAALTAYIEFAMKETRVPGAAFGLIQDGKVVYAGGFGVRELGKPDKVDADTRFLIASVTKPMTTLMLGKLVDQKRFDWDTPATSLLPTFKLGDAATTAKVQVKHLICACTGMPRRDFEWLLEYEKATALSALGTLATMQPSSAFGELFQYSNPMAAAAGYLGGHVAYPGMELGAAYDKAMRDLVFAPLGMNRTTFDFDLAETGNAAVPHAPDIDGRVRRVDPRTNRSAIHVRPAAAAWSSVNDLLKVVAMELAEGVLPDGSRYISREALLARRVPQIKMSPDASYGMGLRTSTEYGTPVVWHDGFMFGFHSIAVWLPEHGVGAVVLTNGHPGWHIQSVFPRKLLEVLFGGRPEADETLAVRAQAYYQWFASERKRVALPADPKVAQALAARYRHPAVGDARVVRAGESLHFDFGEWSSEMASLRNPDGTDSLITVGPGTYGFEFLVGRRDGKRTLLLRDAQHRYELVEAE